VGKCFDCRVEPERIAARICGVPVLARGLRTEFDEAAVRALLRTDPVDLEVELDIGEARARAWGCDLTHGYVDENAAYYSS
jgi:glutamate N-acetyltransferase/amino-acid N-acetyltransferase